MKFADFVIPEGLDEARSVLKKLGKTGFPVAGATAFQYLSDRDGITAVDITRLGLDGIQHLNGTNAGFGYKKENVSNSAFGLMVAAVAIHVASGALSKVRLAVGSGVPVPMRLPAIVSFGSVFLEHTSERPVLGRNRTRERENRENDCQRGGGPPSDSLCRGHGLYPVATSAGGVRRHYSIPIA